MEPVLPQDHPCICYLRDKIQDLKLSSQHPTASFSLLNRKYLLVTQTWTEALCATLPWPDCLQYLWPQPILQRVLGDGVPFNVHQ